MRARVSATQTPFPLLLQRLVNGSLTRPKFLDQVFVVKLLPFVQVLEVVDLLRQRTHLSQTLLLEFLESLYLVVESLDHVREFGKLLGALLQPCLGFFKLD